MVYFGSVSYFLFTWVYFCHAFKPVKVNGNQKRIVFIISLVPLTFICMCIFFSLFLSAFHPHQIFCLADIFCLSTNPFVSSVIVFTCSRHSHRLISLSARICPLSFLFSQFLFLFREIQIFRLSKWLPALCHAANMSCVVTWLTLQIMLCF